MDKAVGIQCGLDGRKVQRRFGEQEVRGKTGDVLEGLKRQCLGEQLLVFERVAKRAENRFPAFALRHLPAHFFYLQAIFFAFGHQLIEIEDGVVLKEQFVAVSIVDDDIETRVAHDAFDELEDAAQNEGASTGFIEILAGDVADEVAGVAEEFLPFRAGPGL